LTGYNGTDRLDVKVQISNCWRNELISQTAEYALRAVVCLASRSASPLVTQQIAEITKVPAGYLSKVLQTLGRAGLVRSNRGLHGGFVLTRPADRLTVLEVINAVDPLKRIECCPLDIKTHRRELCPLHKRLDEAVALVETAFKEHTIGQLVAEDSASKPFCECSRREEAGSVQVPLPRSR
jgi:Rrf2 family transcriptional regulator, nitric oxide-sensitive transcriptional repressor